MAGKQKRNSSSENLEKDVSKGKASWSRKKVYVHIEHRCQMKYIVQANALLSNTHRAILEFTPFSSCLRLKKELNINCALLREVLSQWVPNEESIQIRQQLANYVHNFIIASLNRSSIVYREKENEHTIFVSGSVIVVQTVDEDHSAACDVVQVNGGRDNDQEINVEEGHIEFDNTGGPKPLTIGE
ncbi:hypothetical protein DEO72_LG5g1686 [Vigna unguiculata]|uniref:Uncharacterized protein n=1 Tax=Vigna unguiculata TaxID=3917 RepID=A0A4D6LZ30_VIGUN|nr:hypothetical protein DEO72_LG5g1686 [Vigna unguiculata]